MWDGYPASQQGAIDYTFLIVKVVSSVIAGAYGVYATVTDFHEKRNGRQVLSRSGRIGLAILLVATCASISVDAWKELSESRASAKVSDRLKGIANDLSNTDKTLKKTGTKLDDANTKLVNAQSSLDSSSAQISSNVSISKSVLSDTQRALDPIEREWILVKAEVDVPTDHVLVQPYISRLEDDCGTNGPGVMDLYLGDSSRSFPRADISTEQTLAELAHFQGIEIAFRRRLGKRKVEKDVGLSLDMQCDAGKSIDRANVRSAGCDIPEKFEDLYSPGNHIEYERSLKIGGAEYNRHLHLRCYADAVRFHDTPSIRSYSDLSGAAAKVEVKMAQLENPSVELRAFEIPFQLSEIVLESKIGHRFCIIQGFTDMPCSEATLPGPYRSSCFAGSVPTYCWDYKP